MIHYGSSSLSADLRAERVQKDPHTISHNLEKLKLEGNWITSELTQPRWPPALCALWRFRASNPDPSSSPHSLLCLVGARISIRSCQIPSNTPQRWWTISSGFLNAQIGRKRPVSWATHRKVITRSYILFHLKHALIHAHTPPLSMQPTTSFSSACQRNNQYAWEDFLISMLANTSRSPCRPSQYQADMFCQSDTVTNISDYTHVMLEYSKGFKWGLPYIAYSMIRFA